MPLDQGVLSLLMLASSGMTTPGAKAEFEAYADGIVNGLKTAVVTAVTTGAGGTPGNGTIVGVINPGPLVLAPLIQAGAVGSLPPIPAGTPTPLQIAFFLALSQIATHLAVAEIKIPPADNVATGAGVVAPGGIVVQGSAIEGLIVAAFVKAQLKPTPSRLGIAKAVGQGIQQFLTLATATVPIVGGVPSSPPSPGAGTRTGTIS